MMCVSGLVKLQNSPPIPFFSYKDCAKRSRLASRYGLRGEAADAFASKEREANKPRAGWERGRFASSSAGRFANKERQNNGL